MNKGTVKWFNSQKGFRKNVFQPCDGDPPCTMYFETVDWATSKPSINSSPRTIHRRRDQPMTRFYQPDLSTDLDSPFVRDSEDKLIRRSYWLDMDDRTLVMVMVNGIGANLTNDEKRAHLIDLRREHLIDKVCCDDSTQRCDSQAGWDFRKGQLKTGPNRAIMREMASGWKIITATSLATASACEVTETRTGLRPDQCLRSQPT
jgi:hypothetical protein